MNLARIKVLAFMSLAICILQAARLQKIAGEMPTAVEVDSNLTGLHRILAVNAVNLGSFARTIFFPLLVRCTLVPSMDPNWKFGEVKINFLMLGVNYKEIVYPLLFYMVTEPNHWSSMDWKKSPTS